MRYFFASCISLIRIFPSYTGLDIDGGQPHLLIPRNGHLLFSNPPSTLPPVPQSDVNTRKAVQNACNTDADPEPRPRFSLVSTFQPDQSSARQRKTANRIATRHVGIPEPAITKIFTQCHLVTIRRQARLTRQPVCAFAILQYEKEPSKLFWGGECAK